MNTQQQERMWDALTEVQRERFRQHETHGEQNLPRDMPPHLRAFLHDALRTARAWQRAGDVTWDVVLIEEVAEALLTGFDDTAHLRAELIQVAAVAVQWVEAIDREVGR